MENKVYIYLEGGVVQEVYTSGDTQVIIIDSDNPSLSIDSTDVTLTAAELLQKVTEDWKEQIEGHLNQKVSFEDDDANEITGILQSIKETEDGYIALIKEESGKITEVDIMDVFVPSY